MIQKWMDRALIVLGWAVAFVLVATFVSDVVR